MSRAVLILSGQDQKAKAIDWVRRAPWNTRIEFKSPKRSLPQNDKMWAMCTDVSEQLSWHGRKLKPGQWKKLFMRHLSAELDLVPNINNNGYVDIGESSSDLGKDEMADLITIIEAFGAEHGVQFHEPAKEREGEVA